MRQALRSTEMRTARAIAIATLIIPSTAWAQAQPAHDSAHAAHADMQKRGAEVMGVDQESSVHLFETLPNGGIIELQRAGADSTGARIIRQHLRSIALAFRAGDFGSPSYIHMTSVPGARVMTDRREYIRYDYRELPRGGALRITTTDFVARKAIWEFIAYQRNEHMATAGRGEPR
jgi:hypothetical protein